MSKKTNEITTDIPLTAEAIRQFLKLKFAEESVKSGDIFLPDDSFYLETNPRKQAENMLVMLGKWLGIKPGYIGIEFEGIKYTKSKNHKHFVYIEHSILDDEFVLGAKIALSLTQYLIEVRKNIFSSESEQKFSLIAYASIEFGLGLVIINGLKSKKYLKRVTDKNSLDILQGYSISIYSRLLQNYISIHQIEDSQYQHCLTPEALKHLNLAPSKNPTDAIKYARTHAKAEILKTAGITILFFIVSGVGIYTFTQKIKPIDKNIVEAKQNILIQEKSVKECEKKLAYDKQYSDTSDIFTIRSLNSTELRCKSLRNKLDSAEKSLSELIE